MAMPSSALSSIPFAGDLLTPESAGRAGRFEDFELGGIALSDPSQGLQVQTWRVRIDGEDIKIGPHPGGPETVLFTAAGTTEVSLAFDQNMRPAVAFVQSGVAKLRWFDPVAAAQVITNVGFGARTPMVTLDDKRQSSTASSDIILAYLVGGSLMYRQQRDRFLNERTLRTGLATDSLLHQLGMGRNGRLHFVISGAGFDAATVGLMSATEGSADDFAATGTVTDPPAGEYRYWRILITANNGDTDFTGVGGFNLRSGATSLSNFAPSSQITASSFFDAGTTPANAVDNLSNTEWVTALGGEAPCWWAIDLLTPQLVDNYTVTSQRIVGGPRAPRDWKLQGNNTSADPAAPWVDMATVTGETGWTNEQTRAFTVP